MKHSPLIRRIILDLAWKYIKDPSYVPKGRKVRQTKSGAWQYETKPRRETRQDIPPVGINSRADKIKLYLSSALKDKNLFNKLMNMDLSPHDDHPLSTYIADKIGYHDPPKIINKDLLFDLDKDDTAITLRRGIGGESLDDFINGKNKIMRDGAYGSGCYTHICRGDSIFNPDKLKMNPNVIGYYKSISDAMGISPEVNFTNNVCERVDNLRAIEDEHLPDAINNYNYYEEKRLKAQKRKDAIYLDVGSYEELKRAYVGDSTVIVPDYDANGEISTNPRSFLNMCYTFMDMRNGELWDKKYMEPINPDDPMNIENIDTWRKCLESYEEYLDDGLTSLNKICEGYKTKVESLKESKERYKKILNEEIVCDDETKQYILSHKAKDIKKYVGTKSISKSTKSATRGAIDYAKSACKYTPECPGMVLGMVLDPSAKIGDYDDLRVKSIDWSDYGISNADHIKLLNRMVRSDVGLVALLSGYDAYEVKRDNTNSNSTDYLVILNRGMISMVSEPLQIIDDGRKK